MVAGGRRGDSGAMRSHVVWSALLVAACGGGGQASVDAAPAIDATPTVDADPDLCASASPPLHATFSYQLFAGGVSNVNGSIYDRATPDTSIVGADEAGCRYVAPGSPFCDPACTGGICDLDGACQPYPVGLGAGTVSTTGTHPVLEIPPNQFPGSYYPGEGLQPGFVIPGETVGFVVPGDDAPAMSGEVVMIAALELPTIQVTATEHQPLTIAWTPAPAGQGGQVIVHFDNDHHGTRSYLECIADDADGELTIPVSVLDPLIADGASGIGTYIENAYVLRRQRTVIATPLGCAAIESTSDQFVSVETVLAK